MLPFSFPLLATQPNPYQSASGSKAGTGVVCTLTSPYATSYTVIVDGELGAGVGTVAISTFSTGAGTYEPITTPAYNALSCTAATLFVETIQGPLPGIQVSVTAYTSGTISAIIIAN